MKRVHFFAFKKDKAILADSAASVSMEIGSGIYISNAWCSNKPFSYTKEKNSLCGLHICS